MNKIAAGQTILLAFKNAQILATAIEELVAKRCSNSAVTEKKIYMLKEFALISRLIERKWRLNNFCIRAEKALSKMQKQQKEILVLKYFDKFSHQQIMDYFDIKHATYFLNLEKSFISFANEFDCSLHCKQLFLDEPWISKLYKWCIKKQADRGINAKRDKRKTV